MLRYIPLFVFARKGIKIEKRGKNKMAAGFERSGTVLTVHLPTELDHPVSDEIRRESDRQRLFLWTVPALAFLWDGTGHWE